MTKTEPKTTEASYNLFSHHATPSTQEIMDQMERRKIMRQYPKLVYGYERYMWFVSIVGPICFYLQAALILSNRSSENVSLPATILLLIIMVSWLGYGILWQSHVIVFSAVLCLLGVILILVATLSFRPLSTPGPFTANLG